MGTVHTLSEDQQTLISMITTYQWTLGALTSKEAKFNGISQTEPLPWLKNASRTPLGHWWGVTPPSNGHCDALLIIIITKSLLRKKVLEGSPRKESSKKTLNTGPAVVVRAGFPLAEVLRLARSSGRAYSGIQWYECSELNEQPGQSTGIYTCLSSLEWS